LIRIALKAKSEPRVKPPMREGMERVREKPGQGGDGRQQTAVEETERREKGAPAMPPMKQRPERVEAGWWDWRWGKTTVRKDGEDAAGRRTSESARAGWVG
jgi:hypothetical protein